MEDKTMKMKQLLLRGPPRHDVGNFRSIEFFGRTSASYSLPLYI